MTTEIRDCDIYPFNTFRLHSKAGAVATFNDADDLAALLGDATLPQPFKAIGAGSNLLFAGDFPGTLLRSTDTAVVYRPVSDNLVQAEVGAGTIMDDFCIECCRRNLWGPENLSGIPGTAGASAVQNVGAYGVEAGDLIDSVKAFDTVGRQTVTFSNKEMEFGYRDSIFKHPHIRDRYIILSVVYNLTPICSPRLKYANLGVLADRHPDSPLSPMEVRDEVIRLRDSKLPDVNKFGSAGSFFKNPVVDREKYDDIVRTHPGMTPPSYLLPDGTYKIPAAWLIDKAGCKGKQSGGAAVWTQQPLVLVNLTGTATAADIIALRDSVIEAVELEFGIHLHPEVEQIGSSIQ